MHPRSTISHYTKSTYFPLFEETTAIKNVLDESTTSDRIKEHQPEQGVVAFVYQQLVD